MGWWRGDREVETRAKLGTSFLGNLVKTCLSFLMEIHNYKISIKPVGPVPVSETVKKTI